MSLDKPASVGTTPPRTAQLGRQISGEDRAMLDVHGKFCEAIAAYLADPSRLDLTTDLAVLSRSLNALPVYADLGGALLIRPTGEVLKVDSNQPWSETSEFTVETEPFWIDQAYLFCARRYPALRDAVGQFRQDKSI